MEFIIYLILIADNIRDISSMICILYVLATIILPIVALFYSSENNIKSWDTEADRDIKRIRAVAYASLLADIKRKWFLLLLPLFLSIFSLAFVPSTEKLAAGYIVSSAVTNEELSKLPTKLFEILNLKLDEVKEEITKE